MVEFFQRLFGTDFMPHVYCLRDASVIWLHVTSDAVVAISYFLIPVALVSMIRQRRDLAFPWMFALFGLFILACGSTHLLAIYTLWHPVYRFEGAVKAITALASLPTALILFRLLPRVVALPSPAQLRESNEALASEVNERRLAEQRVRDLNVELEHRVRERTADLEAANQKLRIANEHLVANGQALKKSEAQFRTLVEAVPDIVWTPLPQGKVDYFNSRWFAYTGQSEEESRDWGWTRAIHPDDVGRCLERWNEALRTVSPYEVEYRIRKRDGNYRWFLGRALALRSDSEVDRWLGSCTDIQNQKEAAETLERNNQELEELAFATAHDLQEPLRLVILQTQMMQLRLGAHADSAVKELAGHVVEGARRLHNLQSAIMEYVHVSSGDWDPRPTRSETSLKKAIASVPELTGPPDARISYDALPEVLAQPEQLTAVFRHLLSNAVKYAGREALRIHVAASTQGGEVCFIVKDNGIGIGQQFHERIFGLFKRLHGPDVPGTGVGLALCRKIIQRHGGRIWVQSAPGEGAAFHFTMKAVARTEAQDRPAGPSGPAPWQTPEPLPG